MRDTSVVLSLVLAAAAAFLPDKARADSGGDDSMPHGVVVGARVGGLLPTTSLGAGLTGGLELGWFAAARGGRFGLVLGVDYASPERSGSEADPRVTGGSYSWHLTQRELTTSVAFIYRVAAIDNLVPYVGLGARMYVLESIDRSGDSGPTIEQTDETSGKVGVIVPVGVELSVGPGAATGELMYHLGTLDHRATGDTNTGAFSLTFGYRLFL